MTGGTLSAPQGNSVGPSDNKVQLTRAWTGFLVVMIGDVAIAAAAILGLVIMAHVKDTTATMVMSVLSIAFTAIATMTTAYFGIRAASNTAQSSIASNASDDGAGQAAAPPR